VCHRPTLSKKVSNSLGQLDLGPVVRCVLRPTAYDSTNRRRRREGVVSDEETQERSACAKKIDGGDDDDDDDDDDVDFHCDPQLVESIMNETDIGIWRSRYLAEVIKDESEREMTEELFKFQEFHNASWDPRDMTEKVSAPLIRKVFQGAAEQIMIVDRTIAARLWRMGGEGGGVHGCVGLCMCLCARDRERH
jgi:hypothetical protein